MVDIYFIRHGETGYNVERRYYGRSNPEMTVEGVKQLTKISRQLKLLNIDTIITSKLERTIKSAEIICEENHWPKDMIHAYEGLDELDFGLWDGLTADEVAKLDPAKWQGFMDAPFSLWPSEGEAFKSFKSRVLKTFEEVLQTCRLDSRVLFVGHLGVMRVIIAHYFESENNFFNIHFDKNTFKHYVIGGYDG